MHRTINCFTSQSNTKAYERIEEILERAMPHREYPCPSGTVHRAFFLYGLRWSQHQARISEMNDAGWKITSIDLPRPQWVNGIRTAYRLDSKPLKPSAGVDWYVAATGRERPKSHPFAQPFSEKRIAENDCFVLTAPEPQR